MQCVSCVTCLHKYPVAQMGKWAIEQVINWIKMDTEMDISLDLSEV